MMRRTENRSPNFPPADESEQEEDLTQHHLHIHFQAPKNYVPGWSHILDVWVAMDGICRNQVKLAKDQADCWRAMHALHALLHRQKTLEWSLLLGFATYIAISAAFAILPRIW